ncbi:MAG: bifunctional riboflavin kinase/FAD synthetase [Acidobacteriota bacterium]|nr:bifunctional riboflavin kinase/FAD synthetase [Acidobacteriota bacterium]
MQVFYKLEDISPDYGRTVVSVGNFDGVHRAHMQVLKAIVDRAKSSDAKAIAVCFEPHPTRVLRPDKQIKLITPTAEKLRLLKLTGVHAVLLLPFTRDLSLMPPPEFAELTLHQGLHACEVHEGYNFRFGYKAEGDPSMLASFGRKMDFEVKVHPEMMLRGQVVSSTQVRRLLAEGQVSRARYLLGRAFSITAQAAPGRGYGSKYTVPTINLSEYRELVPRDGVYVTRTRVGEECFDSVTNVGNRPTFGEDSFAIETHLLNFHPIELLPHSEIEVYFLSRLRDEIKFPSVEALREQIGKDVHRAQRYFRPLVSG